MTIGLLGRKVGMTQIFAPDGTSVPVTVVSIEPNTVTKLRTPDQDGYTAVQLGIEAGKRRLNKPDQGQFKGELPACSVVREFRVESTEGMTLGQTLDVSLFADGDLVDVTGISKGKGFAGTIKRHSFASGPETHGADHHREPGSIGAGTTPGRVYRGTRMPATWVSIAPPFRRSPSFVLTARRTCCSSRARFLARRTHSSW